MRIIFTTTLILLATGLYAQIACRIIIRDSTRRGTVCAASISSRSEPLFILNSKIVGGRTISDLDRSSIDSIWVLKGSEGQAIYGIEGRNGVIIVSTKQVRQLVIKDAIDSTPIIGATVLFNYLKDQTSNSQFAADNKGIVCTRCIRGSGTFEVVVSAVGYIPATKKCTENSSNEIFLNRDIKECLPVVVRNGTTIYCRRTRVVCGYFYCKTSGINITNEKTIELSTNKKHDFKVFPNPVLRGSTINVEFKSEDRQGYVARIISIGGNVIAQEPILAIKGTNSKRIFTQSRWAAGTYLIQLLYENGEMLASEKIIIQ
jgi:TonB-dependent SusC/RagA subfamily outer membrane receptor